jgi:hypothetical protein
MLDGAVLRLGRVSEHRRGQNMQCELVNVEELAVPLFAPLQLWLASIRREYTAKVWGEAEVPRGRTALTEEPGIGYTGGAWSYWSK